MSTSVRSKPETPSHGATLDAGLVYCDSAKSRTYHGIADWVVCVDRREQMTIETLNISHWRIAAPVGRRQGRHHVKQGADHGSNMDLFVVRGGR